MAEFIRIAVGECLFFLERRLIVSGIQIGPFVIIIMARYLNALQVVNIMSNLVRKSAIELGVTDGIKGAGNHMPAFVGKYGVAILP